MTARASTPSRSTQCLQKPDPSARFGRLLSALGDPFEQASEVLALSRRRPHEPVADDRFRDRVPRSTREVSSPKVEAVGCPERKCASVEFARQQHGADRTLRHRGPFARATNVRGSAGLLESEEGAVRPTPVFETKSSATAHGGRRREGRAPRTLAQRGAERADKASRNEPRIGLLQALVLREGSDAQRRHRKPSRGRALAHDRGLRALRFSPPLT